MNLEALDHVALAVRDVEQSARWYTEVLGFERRYPGMWGGVPVFVGNGNAAIALFPIRKNHDGNTRGGASILHFAFRSNRTGFESAQKKLRDCGIKFEFEDHEISHSIYFRDPDGHHIEVTTYEL